MQEIIQKPLLLHRVQLVRVVKFISRALSRKDFLHTLCEIRRHLVHPLQMLECQLGILALRERSRVRDDVPDLAPICFVGLRYQWGVIQGFQQFRFVFELFFW